MRKRVEKGRNFIDFDPFFGSKDCTNSFDQVPKFLELCSCFSAEQAFFLIFNHQRLHFLPHIYRAFGIKLILQKNGKNPKNIQSQRCHP